MGLAQGTISSARTKKKIPSLWLLKIAGAGISVDWVLFGIGSMLRRDLCDSGPDGRCLDVEGYALVPMLESRVTAGPEGEILYEEVADQLPFKRWWVDQLVGYGADRRKALILVRVRGDSMSPTINQGEVVLVDTHEAERLQLINGRIYLVMLPDGSVSLKRLVLMKEADPARLLCLSDNTAYRPFEFPLEPSRRLKNYVLGRIRWCGKEFE